MLVCHTGLLVAGVGSQPEWVVRYLGVRSVWRPRPPWD